MKFWDLPDAIKEIDNGYNLDFDGDKGDFVLHLSNSYYWGNKDEAAYKEIENRIDNISYKGNGWQLYAWYDSSGFSYWMEHMEEANYIQITVRFNSEDIDEGEIQEIISALDKAMDEAGTIQECNQYP